MVERVEVNMKAGIEDADADAANKAAEAAVDAQDADLNQTHGEPEAQKAPVERPENVPEKFWDAEKGEVNMDAILKSNAELEKKLGAPRDQPQEEAATPPPDGEADAGVDVEAALNSAEVEYGESGELSSETYDSLEKAGYSKDLVDRYIAGQEALANSVQQEAYSHAGGEESYKAMLNWGIENLTEEEVKAFDLQVTNPELRAHAIQSMFTRYQKEADVEPSLLGGDNNSNNGDYFKTSKEMIAAMSSREYKTDVNFQQEVQRKIQRSEAAGIRLFG